MSENQEDFKFNLAEDSRIQEHFERDQDDPLKQIIVCDLLGVKKEELDQDSEIVKEEPMLLETMKTETGTKPLLDNSDSVIDAIKTEEIYIKSEPEEEEYIHDSTSSHHIISKKYGDTAADTDQPFNGRNRTNNFRRSRIQISDKGKAVFKCKLCDFHTIWPASLKRHLVTHRNPEELEWLQCSCCNFRTIDEDRLRRHLLIHKKSQYQKVRCAHCDYQTFRKCQLERHLLTHRNLDEFEWFRCYDCNFRTVHENSLKQHVLIHKKSPIEKFQCDRCDYRTFQKGRLKCHMRKHKSPGEWEIFQCSDCDYRTVWKSYLRCHELIHKKSELEKFRCYHCNYKTTQKERLKKHLIVHEDVDKVDRVRCDECNDTIHKNNFMIHMLKHNSPRGDEWFQCSHCDFGTVQKNCFRAHSLIHKKPEVE